MGEDETADEGAVARAGHLPVVGGLEVHVECVCGGGGERGADGEEGEC